MAADASGLVDLAALTALFEQAIPFNRHLGLRVDALARGRVAIRQPFGPHLIGDPTRPALHGGVIATLADTAGGLAVFTRTEPGDRVATIDLRVDYLLPGRGADLVARAEVLRLGNRVGVSSIEVVHPDEPDRLVAVAKGVYTVKRAAESGGPGPGEGPGAAAFCVGGPGAPG